MGETPGSFELLIKRNNAGHNHIDNLHVPTKNGRPRTRRVEPEKEVIEVRTMDSYNFTEVDIIKIDTEGYEYPVILGAEKTIMDNRPIVQVEMIEGQPEKFGYSCQQIVDWFVARDFDVYLCDGTNVGEVWSPVRKKVERFFVPKERDLQNFLK